MDRSAGVAADNRKWINRFTGSTCAVAVLSLAGCTSSIAPTSDREELTEGAEYQVEAVMTPEIIPLNGAPIGRPRLLALRGTAIARVRNGVLRLDGADPEDVARIFRTQFDPYTVSADTLAMVLPVLGFTSGANPAYSTTVPVESLSGTSQYVVPDTNIVETWTRNTYGAPLTMVLSVDNIKKLDVRYTWETYGPGFRLVRMLIKDFNTPDYEIRWTIDITTARVVVLSGVPGWLRDFAAASGNVASTAVSGIGQFCLPRPLHAEVMPLSSGCGMKAVMIMVNLLGVAVSGAGLVAAVNSGNVWGIRAAVGAGIVATARAVASAADFQKECLR